MGLVFKGQEKTYIWPTTKTLPFGRIHQSVGYELKTKKN